MEDLGLCDLGYVGSWYTWERGNRLNTDSENTMIFIANSQACNLLILFSQAGVEHVTRYAFWLLDLECEKVLRESWFKDGGMSVT